MNKNATLIATGVLLSLSACTEPTTSTVSAPEIAARTAALLTQTELPIDEPRAIPDPVDAYASAFGQVSDGYLAITRLGTTYRALRFDSLLKPRTDLPSSFTLTPALSGRPRLVLGAGQVLMHDVNGRMLVLDEDGKPASGLAATVAAGAYSVSIAASAGGAYMAVYAREQDIFARQIDVSGQPTGPELSVCNAPGEQLTPTVACRESECLVAWTDHRNPDHADADLYAARIVLPSYTLPEPNGVPIATSPTDEYAPGLARQGDGYLLVHMSDNQGTAMRQPSGQAPRAGTAANFPIWTYSGNLLAMPYGDNVLVRSDYGAVFMIRPDLSSAQFNVYADGATRLVSGAATAGNEAAVLYEQETGSGYPVPVYAARLDPSTLGNEPPVLVSRKRNQQLAPVIASNGDNYMAMWQDSRPESSWSTRHYARFDLTGALEAGPVGNGLNIDFQWIQPLGNRYMLLHIAPGSSRNAPRHWVAKIVDPHNFTTTRDAAFSDYVYYYSGDVRRARPDLAFNDQVKLLAMATGNAVTLTKLDDSLVRIGVPETITEAVGNKFDARIHWNGNQFLVVWADGRNGNLDIYAARALADGSIAERTTVQLTSGLADDAFPRIAWNGSRYLVAFSHPLILGSSTTAQWYSNSGGSVEAITLGEELDDPSQPKQLLESEAIVGRASVLADGSQFVVAGDNVVKFFDGSLIETESAAIDGITSAASAGGGQVLVARSYVDADGYTRAALRRLSRGGALGSPCDAPADCADGLCVDGVCCNSECGGGVADCQACSVAGGGTSDGVCKLLAGGTSCRAARGACDAAELCTGTSADCPVDARQPASAVCRGAAGPCDLDERCDGDSDGCPDDTLKAPGTSCRAQATVCDAAELCDGETRGCPADGAKPDGTSCSDELACNGADTCQAGSCTHVPLTCEPPDACHAAACVEPEGCSVEPIPGCCLNDEACADEDPCTRDVCQEHGCAHQPILDCGQPAGEDAGTPEPQPGQDAGTPGTGDAGEVEQADDPATGVDAPTGSSKDGCSIATSRDGSLAPWLWALAFAAWIGRRRRRPR